MACHTFRSELAELGLTGLLGGTSMPFAEPGTEPHYAPSRSVRIEHIDLTLDIDIDNQAFSGISVVTFRALPGFEGVVELDLDDATVDSVTNADGNALSYRHDDDVLRIYGVVGTQVAVAFHGNRPSRGLYFTGPEPYAPERQQMAWTQCQDEDAHFIFPCHDHPGTKHAWTFRLRAPAGYTLLGNGAEVEQGEDADGAHALFEQADPMPAYLVVVVAARLESVETEWQGKSVRYLVPEGDGEAVERAFGKTPLMLEHYSHITGVQFPWPRYDQVVVHDFIFGGMENVACTVMTDLLLVDERTTLEWDPDRLVCHELAHQWFGDLLTCQDWSQGFLNESWATFMEVIWWEHDRSETDAIWYKYTQAQNYLSEDSSRYRRPIVSYDFREPIDVFDRHLYEKGACVFNTLRTELGAEAFWAGAHLYLERHRHQTVHARHFQRALEDASGRNLDRFFHQWIHGAGHPDLKVKLDDSDGLFSITVQQTQSGDRTADAFHLPLILEIVMDSGDTRRLTLPIRERERTWAIPVDGFVTTVRVDPGFNMLSTIELEAPRRWLVQLAGDACPVLAVRAVESLLRDGAPQAVKAALHAYRSHPAWQVRSHLAELVGKQASDVARDALLDALKNDEDPRVRRTAATALGTFQQTAVADALLAVLDEADVGTWHFRGAVLEALGKTRDPRAVDAITPHLPVGGWGHLVTNGALSGLAHTRDASVLPTLLAHTTSENAPAVRGAAALALATLADDVESVRGPARERLVEMLTEPGFRSQLSSIGALGRLRDPKASSALERVHRSAPDGRTRRMAYEALYKIRQGRTSEEGLASLRSRIDKLADDNAKLRKRIDKLEPTPSEG